MHTDSDRKGGESKLSGYRKGKHRPHHLKKHGALFFIEKKISVYMSNFLSVQTLSLYIKFCVIYYYPGLDTI